jgi:PKD repeat protein
MKRIPLVRGAQLCLLSVLVTCTDSHQVTPPDGGSAPASFDGAGSTVQFSATSAVDPSVIMWDSFSRTVASGWGTADVGGAWYVQESGATFHVDGARGAITVNDTRSHNIIGIGPVHGSPDMAGYGLNVGGLLAWQLDRMPDGASSRHAIYVYARRNDRVVDGGNTYLFRAKPSRTGVELRIDKTVNDETEALTTTVTIKGTVDISTRWWIRWEVFGVSPATTARMRVWKEGTPEPTVWHRSVVVNEPALDFSGATGVRFAAASNQITFPVSLFVDDLQYTQIGEPPSPNQAPVANPGGPYAALTGAAIAFDGTGSSDPDGNLPLRYAWNFGDGSTGTGATPSHSYAAAGTYTVSLTVTDTRDTSSVVATTTATVSDPPNAAPVASAGGPYSGTAGAATAFDGSGSSDPDGDLPLTYAWNFGDGGTSAGVSPSHTYAAPGTYTVTLTVRDARGLASTAASTSAVIAEPPNQAPVAHAGGPYEGVAGTAVAFNGTASSDPDGNLPLSYAWNFGDGTTGTGPTPTHSFAAAGTYTVSLTVTDARGLSSAAATTSVTVAAQNVAPVARPGGPYTGTAGSAVEFNGSASSDADGNLPLTYAWNFGDGSTGTGATTSHTYAAAGAYTVSLTVTDARGLSSAVASTSATIAERPNKAPVAQPGGPYTGIPGTPIQFNGSASSDPDGNLPLTYAWSFGDGSTGTGATPTRTYSAAGTYTVTLTVTDAKGLSSSPASTTVTVSSMLKGDTFSRIVSAGWGDAEVGGPWHPQPLSAFSVDGSRGVITANDPTVKNVVGRGPFHGASNMPGYGLDVGGLVSYRIDRLPDGATSKYVLQVYARRNDRVSDGDNYYRYRLRISRSAIELRIEKNVNGVLAAVTDVTTIAATFDPNARWWIRWEAFGTSPATTVRMRVWKDGTPEPTIWHRSAVHDEPGLDLSGTTGVRFQPPADQVSFPVRLYIDDLQYTRR